MLRKPHSTLGADNKGSCSNLAIYLEKENEELDRTIKKSSSMSEISQLATKKEQNEYEQIAERINKRDYTGNDQLSQRIETILELRGLCDCYSAQQQALERCRKGREIIKIGSYKEWDR